MALLTWRILILRVWCAQIQKRPPKFTQEWFKTFAHDLVCFHVGRSRQRLLLLQLFQKQQRALLRITLPDLFPQNSTMVELGRSYILFTFFFGVHLPACFGSLEGCSG